MRGLPGGRRPDGTTLSRIDCPSIGVDPFFQITGNVIGKKTNIHLYQMTSDDFFRDYEPSRIINAPIDVIFLDGLHQFEYLLRDFINSEKVTHRHGLIMLDDCLPANAEMTERTHNQEGARTGTWRGGGPATSGSCCRSWRHTAPTCA